MALDQQRTKNCQSCKRPKPIIEFGNGRDETPYCKTCRNNPQRMAIVGLFANKLGLDKLCQKCGENFPIEMFRTSADSPDGHRNWCRNCDEKNGFTGGKYYVKFENATPIIPVTVSRKTCDVCEEEKSTSHFQKDSGTTDGFGSTCKGCVANPKPKPKPKPNPKPVREGDPVLRLPEGARRVRVPSKIVAEAQAVAVKAESQKEEKACTKCKVVKPFGEFAKRALSKDGLQYRCKECQNESKAPKSEGEDMKAKKKQCSRCKADKTADQFSKSSSSKDGLQHWCKLCVKESRNPVPSVALPATPVETPPAVVKEETSPMTAPAPLLTITQESEEIPPDEMVLVVARLLQDERTKAAGLEAAVKEKESIIGTLTDEVKKLRDDLSTANDYVESRDEDLKARDAKIAELEQQLQQLMAQVKPKPKSQYRPETLEVLGNLGLSVAK